MTNGQIAQLQELSKCYMPVRNRKRTRRTKGENSFTYHWYMMTTFCPEYPMGKWDKARLRRLWHQYSHQIKAMKRNRQ